jgi:hypothetical protein
VTSDLFAEHLHQRLCVESSGHSSGSRALSRNG